MAVHTGKVKISFVAERVLRRIVLAVFLLMWPVLGINVAAQDAAPAISTAPLPLDTVVDNLVRKNEERSRNLLHSRATRVYHLSYRGFPGDREAEMTVEAVYDSPATKTFKITSESGSKIILERVFRKLLEGEQEEELPEMNSRTQLNRDNYEFALGGYDSSSNEYELAVTPKSKSKYVYRGRIWVDGADFAVTRIEAEPAKNPSFWTKRSEIRQRYVKIANFWLPARNESTSYIRLGGRAVLTIDYKNYQLYDAQQGPPLVSENGAGSDQ